MTWWQWVIVVAAAWFVAGVVAAVVYGPKLRESSAERPPVSNRFGNPEDS